jgi:hypothetical protein
MHLDFGHDAHRRWPGRRANHPEKLQPEPVIRVGRSRGTPRSNGAGQRIARNECPVCGQANAEFFHGPTTPEFHVIYCG